MHAADWVRKLDGVIKLMQPISDAIHQLEADCPLLSQVLNVWNGLIEHSENWAAGRPAAFSRGMVAAFKARFTKHYQPEMAAACALDPINFTMQGADHMQLPVDGLTVQQRKDVVASITRLNGPATTKAAVNAELESHEMDSWSEDM